jgi:hypothetical protein
MPVPTINPDYPLMTSNFADITDIWLSANSKFKFVAHLFGIEYGVIMFGEFEQGA